jgi:heterodisulfide reductase subunit A
MEEQKKHRIGVYVCHCGGNISDYVDVKQLSELMGKDERVVVSKDVMFACADSNQKEMIDDIRDNQLDGIVVASCSPKLHLHTFRNVAIRAGLNPYQYVQVNVREQCSWAHSDTKFEATVKAAGLIQAGIKRVEYSEALTTTRVEAAQSVAVIGAGVAGLRAGLALAAMGNEVFLIEKAAQAGGNLNGRTDIFPGNANGTSIVKGLIDRVKQTPNIKLFTSTEVTGVSGSIGHFNVKTTVRSNGEEQLEHTAGAILVATGYDHYKPAEGEYGAGNSQVVTLPEFNKLIESGAEKLVVNGKPVKSVAFIYCVGMRQSKGPNKYCSRVCCTAAIHASLSMHSKFNNIKAYHVYRDIRAYGKQEILYADSSKAGDVYLMYTEKVPPVVTAGPDGMIVKVKDLLTKKQEVEIPVDLVVLVTGMVPQADSATVAGLFKIPVGNDKFFNEIHPKLRPVETVINGVFLGGSCQAPKNITESVSSSLSAAGKINAIIGKGMIDLDPVIARINDKACIWCGKCAAVCEYGAIFQMEHNGSMVAAVNDSSCVGCGICTPVCPTNAIELACFTDNEIESMIDGFSLDQNIQPREAAATETTAAGAIGMREYPAVWHLILGALKDGPVTIPAIAAAISQDTQVVTRHVMTMIRYQVVEAAGIDETDEYYLYKSKAVEG